VAPWIVWSRAPERPDSMTPMHEVASALSDAWSAYRATLDRARLEVHFLELRHHVNELVTRIETAGPSTLTDAPVSTGDVVTRGGVLVGEDAYTTGTVRRALGAAEQIVNVLRTLPNPIWSGLRTQMLVPRATDAGDSSALTIARAPPDSTDGVALLHPRALEVYGNTTDLGNYNKLFDDNRQELETIAGDPEDRNSFAAIAALASQARRLDTAEYTACVEDSFRMFMARAEVTSHPRWGACSALDVEAPSELVATFSFGFLGLKLQGQVARDGVHLVPAALVSGPTVTTLPKSIFLVRRHVSRGMGERTEHLTQNARAGGPVAAGGT